MCVAFLYFAFERDYDGLKLKNPCFFMNENKFLWKQNGMENGKFHSHFQRNGPCASLYTRVAN